MQTLEEKSHLVQESEKLKKQLEGIQNERVNNKELIHFFSIQLILFLDKIN
jgi:hypothetical protein